MAKVSHPHSRGVGWQESALSIFMYRKFDVIMTMFSHNIYKEEANIGVLVSVLCDGYDGL